MSQSPRHLLPLHKMLADHLVDRRLDETRGDWLAMTVAVSVVHDKALVVLEGTDELPNLASSLVSSPAIRGKFPGFQAAGVPDRGSRAGGAILHCAAHRSARRHLAFRRGPAPLIICSRFSTRRAT
jgi:hypothetical protein